MDSEPDLSRPSTIKRYPRRIRMGGFLMNVETATAWASRLAGRTLDPIRNSPTIYNVILQKVRPYRVNFKPVGEVADVTYMVITQSAWFKGHKDMDPSLIPHFEEGEREAVARKLLDEQGVHDFEFTTILG
ncbi:hypothetical protein JOM56_014982 [Amanita muscaria]|uniref:Uncharacterized protein n=1 Tax=Amanita muscaria (strain Koide BX008) TaxID=946122 RepID=A0A0C2X3Q2_AMAMK|nr:hypothetical protein M378DRAFT_12235 [Amanita muscaria Koide BX008]